VGTAVLAEAGTCQMEYQYLAYLTGRREYYERAEKIMQLLHDIQLDNGLWNTEINIDSGKSVNNHVTVGGMADSAYEYLLKQYLLTGRSDPKRLDMHLKAVNGIIRNLLFLSPRRNLLYVSDIKNGVLSGKFEHLSCFLPGLLALGLETLDLSDEDRELHIWAAEGLAHSCWLMYADQTSGLGPECVVMNAFPTDWKDGLWIKHVDNWRQSGRPGGTPPGIRDAAAPAKIGDDKDYYLKTSSYLSRPETLESMYLMWRASGDSKWRDRGWAIWEAIESKTRTVSGYASARFVELPAPLLLDSMPSYFLAETIKYAFLLAIDSDPWPADRFVFNTEAHPFPIFDWREWERTSYHVPRFA